MAGPAVELQNCPNKQNYSPCTCGETYDGYSITCNRVPLANISSLFKQNTAAGWGNLFLKLSPTDVNKTIPADLLGNHTVATIQLSCPTSNYFLTIDPNAFRSSRNSAELYSFINCDMNRLDFQFLSGFEKLTSLYFTEIKNAHLLNWTTLPTLNNLKSLTFGFSAAGDLNRWMTFPKLSRGLVQLNLIENNINDVEIDRILNWTLKTSAHTLEYLNLNRNNLTQIPRQISSFTKIKRISFVNQNTGISLISNGSFSFSVNHFLYIVDLNSNKIASIKPGAFQGRPNLFNLLK